MSNKTIAKFFTFVISAVPISAFLTGCSVIAPKNDRKAALSRYDTPQVNGKIRSPDIIESSGIAASRCQNNVLWTHNDSDDGPYIFAINTAGEVLGTWKVMNSENVDWEDISAYKDKDGKCFIYIGDIGDNEGRYSGHAVYRVREPVVAPSDRKSSRQNPLMTEPAGAIRFSYPDGKPNAETLLVDPANADVYVITKRLNGPAGVYRLRPVSDGAAKLEKIAELSVPAIPNGYLTGGDISPDGRRLIICDYAQAYEYTLPDDASNFDDIWRQTPVVVNIGERKQGEGIAYSADGTALFATSEGKNSPLIEVKLLK